MIKGNSGDRSRVRSKGRVIEEAEGEGGAHEGPAGAERKSAQECRHRTPGPGACHKRPSGQMWQPCSSNGKVTPKKELIHSVFQEKAK